MKGVAAAARPAARTRASRCSSLRLHPNHSFATLTFGVKVRNQVSPVRESDNHSLSFHCVPFRILLSSAHFASCRTLALGHRTWAPWSRLAPAWPRRRQPLQRGPWRVNVCLALRQPRPQKPRNTRKKAPGAQASPTSAHALNAPNPSSNLTAANREENKGRAIVVSPSQPLAVKFPTLEPAKTRDLHRSLSAPRARAGRYWRPLREFLP